MTPIEQNLSAKGWVQIFPNIWQKPGSKALEPSHTPVVKESLTVQPAKKRIRQPEDDTVKLNGGEREFLVLMPQIFCCDASDIVAQQTKFRFGSGAWYKVDFVIPRRQTCVEIKGPKEARWSRTGERDIKTAASLFPQWTWVLAWKDEEGIWQTQEVKP